MDIFTKSFLTKKELCIHLWLHNGSVTRLYYFKLREDYFTDDVLKQMGLTLLAYQKIRRFNRKQTAFILKHFKDDL